MLGYGSVVEGASTEAERAVFKAQPDSYALPYLDIGEPCQHAF